MADDSLTPAQRQTLEARHTFQRIVELRVEPVEGVFDAAHLREINRRIFQDLPGLGFSDATPGQYRPPVPNGNDWIKTRKLETVGIRSTVAYSPMDEKSSDRLIDLLTNIDPNHLSKLSKIAFTAAIGKLYSEIDYIHPFPDGNSRTLREFTRQLAERSGYVINWERFNQSPAGRDILYIARDQSVNKLALPLIQQEDTRRAIVLSMDQLDGNRDLQDLLKDVVEIDFEPSLEEQLTEQKGAMAIKNIDVMNSSSIEEASEDGYAVRVTQKNQAESLETDDYNGPSLDD